MIDIKTLTLDEVLDLKRQIDECGLKFGVKVDGRRVRNAREYGGWDWTKSNRELAKEHGRALITVASWRDKLGKPEVHKTKHYPACESWDWSKSDTQIARENKVGVGVVRNYRVSLNKPAAPRDKWQPISTAPKSGKAVLLWWNTCSDPAVGRWSEDDRHEGWRCDGDQCVPKNQHNCTHWMPLPEPPNKP